MRPFLASPLFLVAGRALADVPVTRRADTMGYTYYHADYERESVGF